MWTSTNEFYVIANVSRVNLLYFSGHIKSIITNSIVKVETYINDMYILNDPSDFNMLIEEESSSRNVNNKMKLLSKNSFVDVHILSKIIKYERFFQTRNLFLLINKKMLLSS